MINYRYQNILFETENGNIYYLDERGRQYYYFHPLLSFLVEHIIEKKENDFLSSLSFPLILKGQKYSEEDVSYYYNKMLFLKKHGVIRYQNDHIFYPNMKREEIEESIANTENVVIEMTQKCNLRCFYCTYGELYDRDPFRNNKDINVLLVEKFLLFLYHNYWNTYKNHSLKKQITISFYGGEPLIHFLGIKRIIELTASLENDKVSFKYALTTNGLLINKEIADFLSQYQVEIGISIDGNEENNSYRIFPNGQSSYNMLIDKINFLRYHYTDYFDEKVIFMSVLHNKNSIRDINEYLRDKYNKVVSIGNLNPNCLREDKVDTYKEIENTLQERKNSSEELILKKGIKDAFEYYNSYMISSYVEMFFEYSEKRYPTGTCMPLKKKMFITSEHLLLPCEKIDFRCNFGEIENFKDTFRNVIDIISEKYSQYLNEIKPQCARCYYNKICDKCLFNQSRNKFGQFECMHYFTKQKFRRVLGEYWGKIEKDKTVLENILSNYKKI